MILPFDSDGYLPMGEHLATWDELANRFGHSGRRDWLLEGLRDALLALKVAGCAVAYIDGSFVTDKTLPKDYDACWDARGVRVKDLDPVFLDMTNDRVRQKAKFRGEFFPSHVVENRAGTTFLEFFQRRKDTGEPKGIVRINLSSVT